MPRGQATVAYVVGAPSSHAVVVRGIRVVKGLRLPVPRGDDVGCAGNYGERLPGPTKYDLKSVSPVRFSLDAGATSQSTTLPVRAGGSATGLVSVTTASCTCAWWLELDVEEDGRQVTVRVDDDGRPFTLAPPVTTPLATPADEELHGPRPLSRALGDPRPMTAGISAAAMLLPKPESWEAESDTPQDPAHTFGTEAALRGVGCRRMYASVLQAGGVPAGDHELRLEISGPGGMEGAVLDARVRLASVREGAGQRYRYSCAPAGVDAHAPYDWPGVQRKLYPDTLHALGPFPSGSLRYDPDWTPEQGVGGTMPLAVDEKFTFLEGPVGGGPGTSGISAVISPEQATFGFTVEVTVTLPTGERAELTLSDHGKPFLLGPGTAKLQPSHQEDLHER